METVFERALGLGRMSAGRERKGYPRQRGEREQGEVGRGDGVLEEECDPGEADVPAVEQDASWDFGYQEFLPNNDPLAFLNTPGGEKL